jgi:hypothetical protein
MVKATASVEKQEWDIGSMSHDLSLDMILPYQVPSMQIDNIRLFNILHQPQQRQLKATIRKYQQYSQSITMFHG